jgi:hypothetical protein
MVEERRLWKFSEIPLGIKVFGIGNMVVGSWYLCFFSIYFLFTVIMGWIGDRELYGFIEWVHLVIVNRLVIAVIFTFSIKLIYSGYLLLKMVPRARKLTESTCLIIIFASIINFLLGFVVVLVYPDKTQLNFNFLIYIDIAFIIYSLWAIVYLNNPLIRQLFDDKNIKISFILPILTIVISFFFPLLLLWLISIFLLHPSG